MMDSKRREFREPAKKRKIRPFRLPLLNFQARNYWEMVKIKFRALKGPYNPPKEPIFPAYILNYKGPQQWDLVTEPPIMEHMSTSEIDDLVDSALTSEFECHTQTVEHGVALTAQSVKRRRTEKTQLMNALSTAAAREQLSEKVTHKRFKTLN